MVRHTRFLTLMLTHGFPLREAVRYLYRDLTLETLNALGLAYGGTVGPYLDLRFPSRFERMVSYAETFIVKFVEDPL